ncbi:hypothetical protein [Burkholderia gladioli]|uniref:hypothetical protein n=1 Tax=Burkholderia gladioli TaxID=28095 RepID=UPI000FDB4D41|nr:hypothetical protein [Burkholderia gladioli]
MSQMNQPSNKTLQAYLVIGQASDNYGYFLGEVTAADPCDAVIRVLTMEADNGRHRRFRQEFGTTDDVTCPTRDAAVRAEYALAHLGTAGLIPISISDLHFACPQRGGGITSPGGKPCRITMANCVPGLS